MTIAEMHRGVRTQFEQVASHTLDNFLPQEMDYYLNRSTRTYVDKQRALLLSPREQVQSREANENLRTLISNDTVADTDISSISNYGPGANKVDVSALSDPYSYFLKGRLKTDNDEYLTLRKVSLEEWHEHAPTKHNVPIFRRPVLYEQGSELWILLPNETGAITDLMLTYLTDPAVLNSEVQVTATVADSGGSGTGSISISGTAYDVVWDTDLSTTLQNFIDNNASTIWQTHQVRVERGQAGELVFTSAAFFITPSSFTSSDGQASISLNTTNDRVDSDLPLHVHQDLVDLTVNLLRRDLPQPGSEN